MNRLKDRFVYYQLFRLVVAVGAEYGCDFNNLVVTIKKDELD